MKLQDILPENERVTVSLIAETYRLDKSKLADIVACIASKESFLVELRCRGILIRERYHQGPSSGIDPVGMLVHNSDQRPDRKDLYLVTFDQDSSRIFDTNHVNILRGYIC